MDAGCTNPCTPMKTHQHLIRKVPQAALAAILSLSLALRPAYAVDPGVVTTSGGSRVSAVDGSNSTGYFLQSGTYNISNVTLQNFSTTGGSGSGGGAGLGGVLFINTGASVTLNNVNFLSNNATGGQGGVGTKGGSLNNLFNSGGTTVANGVSGTTPAQNLFTDIGGTTGTKGTSGASNLLGFGGVGGNGGHGGAGGDSSPSLILGTVTASIDVANLLTEEVAAGANR